MNGSATSVGLNFQERVEEEHQNKKRGNGDDSALSLSFLTVFYSGHIYNSLKAFVQLSKHLFYYEVI
jgi:hypothetical protein